MTESGELISETRIVRSRVLFCAFVLLTFAGFIGLDLLTPYCLKNRLGGIFFLILIVGQLTLICVWGTLVEGTFWIRLPWTILLLVVSWGALCYGVYLADGNINSAQVMGMGLVWFYGFVVSYVPLKIAAWLFGWRISLVSENQSEHVPGRYAIRDIMLGTAILAATLAIGRQFISGQWPTWDRVLNESGLGTLETQFVLLLFSIVSLIVKLPCIWIALASHRSKVFSQSLIWIFWSGVLGLMEMLLLIVILGSPGSEVGELFASLILGHAAMAAIMIIILLGLRCFGYRMRRKNKLPPSPSST